MGKWSGKPNGNQEITYPDEIADLVRRVADGDRFARSPKLREFLLYVCERTLSGASAEICEQRIGSDVFGRAPDYDTSADNIVRVEARRLRERLDAYFAEEGKDEPFIISVPRGTYVPVFQPRSRPGVPQAGQARRPPEGVAVRPWAAWLGWALSLLLGVLCVVFWLDKGPGPAVLEPRLRHPDVVGLWGRMFDRDREAILVLADADLILLQDITRQSASLDEYADGRYLERFLNRASPPELATALGQIARRQHTGLADANLAVSIVQINNQLGIHSLVRFSRFVGPRELRGRNVILIGSPRANPWAELYRSRLNFASDFDSSSHRPMVVNRKPLAGEQAVYWTGEIARQREAHAVVSLLPQADGRGKILLLSGSIMEATEAAGDFLLNPQTCRTLVRAMKLEGDAPLGSFEVLLGIEVVAGAGRVPRILAHRVHSR